MNEHTKKKPAAKDAAPIVAVKALDRDFKCRGFQFEVGQTYKQEGKIVACENGFHACLNPFDVWRYYDLTEGTRYALVEMSGATDTHEDDTKIASAEITIKAELKLPEFIKRAVDFVLDLCNPGDESVQASKESYAQLAASGYSAQLAASGDYAKLAASGDSAQLAASGDYAKLAASGDSAQLAASGDSAQLAASGYSAKLAASGYSAKLAASGADSVIASSSRAARAKGVVGTWISLAEYGNDGKCIGFATGCVDGKEIPADVWLYAKNGKLVEAK